jgi:hypothetical protein
MPKPTYQCGNKKAGFAKHVDGEIPQQIAWYHSTKLALPGMSANQTKGVIAAAFEIAQVFVGRKFYRTTKQDRAKIVLQLGKAEEFDGPGGILAWADVVSLRDPAASLIEFDPGESWQRYLKDASAINALNVICHEVGHSLGFGHSRAKNGLMNPYYVPQILAPSLAEMRLFWKEYPELKPAA